MTFTRKTDNVNDVMAEDVNELQEAIEALQAAESPNTYQISATVASNNLTVALKNSAGDDPTPEASVRVQIGDTVYTIDDALFVTAAAATNWFAAGSSESATHEQDFFVYLGYNATDGVTIGFARIPFARVYSDFSSTTTDAKYCRISTITNAAASDPYTVIGRFAATLSAAAAHVWTVPTFTPANLIHQPVFESRSINWTPTYTAGASMTFTLATLNYARYRWRGQYLFVQHSANGTTGGTASNIIYASFPFTIAGAADAFIALAGVRDAASGSIGVGGGGATLTNQLYWTKFDASNFGLGTGRTIILNDFILAL